MPEDASPGVLHTEGVSGIVYDLEIIVVGHFFNRGHIARMSVAMDRHNGGRLRGDRGLNLCGIKVQRIGIDIHKNRLDPVPLQGM
ncbi:hypothetical protein D3C72_1920330 [compost metagenome]